MHYSTWHNLISDIERARSSFTYLPLASIEKCDVTQALREPLPLVVPANGPLAARSIAWKKDLQKAITSATYQRSITDVVLNCKYAACVQCPLATPFASRKGLPTSTPPRTHCFLRGAFPQDFVLQTRSNTFGGNAPLV